ncbi:ribonuclease R [Peptacetobacter hominis]|uniref:Ribonuclease R n=1 Tax=Peptacetobacter hominis TaxID=2743610 RepID=A0A544QY11_9FIRM|nr:ribonuclease R [Peptacetobacter hominis]TQQ85525.1 ribonuclease R [Peptacetobacter hominis]
MIDKVKEHLIGLVNEPGYAPLTKEELAKIFMVHKTERPLFYTYIDELEEDGYIVKSKKGKIMSAQRAGLFVGKFISHEKGFGFVESDEEFVQDLFIPADDVNTAMHGDRVVAEIIKEATEEKRAEGKIIRIIKREITEVVGTFQKSNRQFGFVIPDNKRVNGDVYVPKAGFNGASEGDKVVCKLTVWPKNGKKAEGVIREVIGKKGDRYVEIDSIVRANNLPDDFPKKVLKEAQAVAVPFEKEHIEKRADYRDWNIFTIDGSDAKDLDDAVSVSKLPNGHYRLGVHIADVTHYVKEGSKIDKEAIKRATSVYLVDKVIPMLPKELSNGVCSLNRGEDKLTLSVIMEIDRKGNVVDHEITESVIRSKARMTYTEVSDILEKNDEKLCKTFAHLVDDFRTAEELARILMDKRDRRGAIDFNFPESKIVLDSEGIPVDIEPYERRIANRMIEEFMLVTNETVAEHFYWMTMPFVYRIHENPATEKMETLGKFIATFGYKVNNGKDEEIHPKALQKVIKQIAGTKEEHAISAIMLRSLRQARYSPVCEGHFGLAAKYYSHFTSPIRRYPDLQIHRIIKEVINGRMDDKAKAHFESVVSYISDHSSEQERAAEVAEREVDDYYKAVYMEKRIGKEYNGVISGVTNFGIFVELENSVEGLARLADMNDDYYDYFEETFCVIGERTKKTYRIGDSVRIKVINADVDRKEIDFKILRKNED